MSSTNISSRSLSPPQLSNLSPQTSTGSQINNLSPQVNNPSLSYQINSPMRSPRNSTGSQINSPMRSPQVNNPPLSPNSMMNNYRTNSPIADESEQFIIKSRIFTQGGNSNGTIPMVNTPVLNTNKLSFSKTRDFNNLKFLRKLGKGTYGTVKSYILPTGQLVAIKKVQAEDEGISSSTLREIHTMRTMEGCANVLQLLGIEAYVKDGFTKIRLMLTYHKADMKFFMEKIPLFERIKYSELIIRQLLNGLYQLWNRGIMHRDIKPANILIDYQYSTETNQLLAAPICYIADFGSARQFPCNSFSKKFIDGGLTLEVYTSIYRPPEILLETHNYNDNADIWALGITIIEYFTGKYLFADSISEFDVLRNIMSKLTNPIKLASDDDINLDDIHDTINVNNILRSRMSEYYFDSISNDILNLLPRMLEVNPNDRDHITDLIRDVDYCSYTPNVTKGQISIYQPERITKHTVYILVDWIIDVCEMFKLRTRTMMGTIDMIFRVVNVYPVPKSKLQLVGVACLSLMAKMNEVYPPEIGSYIYVTANTFNSQEIKEMELIILEQLNYILISCEIDNFVAKLNLIQSKELMFGTVKELFKSINDKGIYIGVPPYENIITYWDNLGSR